MKGRHVKCWALSNQWLEVIDCSFCFQVHKLQLRRAFPAVAGGSVNEWQWWFKSGSSPLIMASGSMIGWSTAASFMQIKVCEKAKWFTETNRQEGKATWLSAPTLAMNSAKSFKTSLTKPALQSNLITSPTNALAWHTLILNASQKFWLKNGYKFCYTHKDSKMLHMLCLTLGQEHCAYFVKLDFCNYIYYQPIWLNL